jgi:hypothetical protein
MKGNCCGSSINKLSIFSLEMESLEKEKLEEMLKDLENSKDPHVLLNVLKDVDHQLEIVKQRLDKNKGNTIEFGSVSPNSSKRKLDQH